MGSPKKVCSTLKANNRVSIHMKHITFPRKLFFLGCSFCTHNLHGFIVTAYNFLCPQFVLHILSHFSVNLRTTTSCCQENSDSTLPCPHQSDTLSQLQTLSCFFVTKIYYPHTCLQIVPNYNNFQASILAEIKTKHLQNTSHEHYHYTSLICIQFYTQTYFKCSY
jgi:hypothetical protein